MVSTTGTTAYRTDADTRERNSNLIASDRVEGTELFGRDGEKLGTVRKMMIDKKSGQVRNVIVGYGGLFGMGEDHYPMPWDALEYNEDRGGYVTKFERNRLDPAKAPKFKADEEPDWDTDYEREVRLYYFPA